ncbi:MAG: DoxX family membrane protein [Gordonia sp. (in: high G+C Gram-positive bacteria)]|uniref:DoxX family protein n=1 Tax=Gordonia sp. (in: high G+C Gram-positive bacteria) TaxID=84139 RepID=UPI0039E6A36D
MSSSSASRPPRRPQPDRDSFYEKYARRSPARTVVEDSGDEIPEAVIMPGEVDESLPTVEYTFAGRSAGRAEAPVARAETPAAAEPAPTAAVDADEPDTKVDTDAKTGGAATAVAGAAAAGAVGAAVGVAAVRGGADEAANTESEDTESADTEKAPEAAGDAGDTDSDHGSADGGAEKSGTAGDADDVVVPEPEPAATPEPATAPVPVPEPVHEPAPERGAKAETEVIAVNPDIMKEIDAMRAAEKAAADRAAADAATVGHGIVTAGPGKPTGPPSDEARTAPLAYGLPPIPPTPERTGATRIDVRSASDTVVTEPFVDNDDTDPEGRPVIQRSTAEHLTEDPLPYIEPQPTAEIELDDDEVFAAAGTDYADPDPIDDDPVTDRGATEPAARRGTIDLGLLILRVTVGLVFVGHGLQKLLGWWGGPGLDGFATFLAQNGSGGDPTLGFDPDLDRTLALVTGLTETIGGTLLILGLLAPVAGASLVGVILVAVLYRITLAGGFWFFTTEQHGPGLEFELTLTAAVLALTLCGPGTYSLDRRWGWARRPAWGSAAWVIIAIAAAVAGWVVFNGSNPFAAL